LHVTVIAVFVHNLVVALVLCVLQALALEFGERADASHDGSQVAADNNSNNNYPDSTFYEITIATVDQPKLLSRLSDAMVRSCPASCRPQDRLVAAIALGAAEAWARGSSAMRLNRILQQRAAGAVTE
jgi:transcriptional regulator of nitric oxide reductase